MLRTNCTIAFIKSKKYRIRLFSLPHQVLYSRCHKRFIKQYLQTQYRTWWCAVTNLVDWVLTHAVLPKDKRTQCESIFIPYRLFILVNVEQNPTLSVLRLYYNMKQWWYQGCDSHFRELRPGKQPEAFLRLKDITGWASPLRLVSFLSHIDRSNTADINGLCDCADLW